MSMHLLGPMYNTNGSTKTKSSAKQLKAKAEHEAWLRANGVHPDQLKHKKKHKIALPSYKTDTAQLSNTIQDGGRANGVMANLYKEKRHVQNEILAKAKGVTQLYNKGGYGVAVPSDGNMLGSRSRRG
jgi:phage protein D